MPAMSWCCLPDRDHLPTLILTGGFLGAGKTTLLLRAARLLQQRGMRGAIITNDQGGSLVDTRVATAAGFDAGEIAGACFCCRFGDFIGAAESLLDVRQFLLNSPIAPDPLERRSPDDRPACHAVAVDRKVDVPNAPADPGMGGTEGMKPVNPRTHHDKFP